MIFFVALSRLPLSILYLLSFFIYLLLRYLFQYRVSIVRENLTRSFPEKNVEEIEHIINQHYRNMADVVVETIKLLSMSEEELNKRVAVKNPDELLQYFDKGTSVLLTACHQFNWEWMVAVGRTKLGYSFDPAYRPLKNKFFNNLIIKVRSRYGGRTIIDKDLKETLRKGEGTVGYSLVMDHLSGKPFAWKKFLSQTTLVDNSIEVLANLSQLPVVYPKLRKIKRGYYEIELIPIANPPYSSGSSMLDTYLKNVELSIRNQPETYMWTHRRWKYDPALTILD